MKVYMGWDALDMDAYRVAAESVRAHSTCDIQIIPVMEHMCRQRGIFWRDYFVDPDGQKYDRKDGKPFSTQFSFTRFCVPLLTEYADEWVVFMDPDMLVEADFAELLEIPKTDPGKALWCVQHEHVPEEHKKMGGLLQTRYKRKNWSSFMLLNPDRNRGLTQYALNNETGAWLHALLWLDDSQIGALDESWNWLEGHSSPEIDPKVIHYTRGTPDLPGCAKVEYAQEWNEAYMKLKPLSLFR